MKFRTQTNLAQFAREAVDLKARMDAYCHSTGGRRYLEAYAQSMHDAIGDGSAITTEFIDAVHRCASSAWRIGEPYVLAPSMTAVVAAAADALDLTGDILHTDVAPCDFGVLYLPEPIYYRRPRGNVSGIAAITWSRLSSSRGTAWAICGWSDLDDRDDTEVARVLASARNHARARAALGPYLLTDLDHVPIGTAVPGRETRVVAEDVDWQPDPDGRYVIDASASATAVCTTIAYAFWRIQEQPIATVANAPLDGPLRRRAQRASIVHDTRVVMLRRFGLAADRGDGEARWHYRVRFLVRLSVG